MTSCELCGKEDELYKALVEGTTLLVCKGCARFGTIINKVTNTVKESKKDMLQLEVVEVITEDFPSAIKQTREKLGISQRDFALKINEKESLVHKLESGRLKPTLELARKLEQMFNLKLVEEIEDTQLEKKGTKSASLTLGDVIHAKD